MDAENRAQIVLLALVFPFGQAIDGLILPVGLDDAKLQVSGDDGVDVEH